MGTYNANVGNSIPFGPTGGMVNFGPGVLNYNANVAGGGRTLRANAVAIGTPVTNIGGDAFLVNAGGRLTVPVRSSPAGGPLRCGPGS